MIWGKERSRTTIVFTSLLLTILALPAVTWGSGFLALPLGETHPITCRWSCLNDDGSTYYHQATDYGQTGLTTNVLAAASGEVAQVSDDIPANTHPRGAAYGNQVRIRHLNGYLTIYAHLLPNTITVRVGDRVETGQRLGLSDNTGKSTGPHLHFEVRDPQGRRVNPYGDPPDYSGGCGPNALWVTCPPTPAPPPDSDGDGYTTAQGDCDDTNRDVRPGATERCNGRDDNCNRTIDDPWADPDLAQRIGASCTVGRGACTRTGQWACAPDGRATVCNATPGASSTESCNAIDDDCDGATDENWRTGLAQDLGNPCTIEWDTCRGSASGTWACAPDGRATVCDAPTPAGTPATIETCNGVDDDCDEIIDGSERLRQIWECRQYFSVAANASVSQFGIATTERELCPRGNEAWSARMLTFERRDRNLLPLGEPITLEVDGSSIYGVSVVALSDSYAIVWLAYAEPASASVGRLMFSRVSAVGDTLVAPTVLREVVIDRNVHRSQLHLAGGAGALHAVLVDPVTLSPRWYAINRETGDITERERLEPVNGSGWEIALQHLDIAIVDGTRIAAWFERLQNHTNQALIVGSWSSDETYASAEIARGEFGWTANPAIECPDETSCVLAWTWSLLSNRGVAFSTVSIPTFAVAPYWVGWVDGPRDWLVASIQLACYEQTCVPLLITNTGEAFFGARVSADGSYEPVLRFTQVCAQCDAVVIVTSTDSTVFWTSHILAFFPSSPQSHFVATTMACR